MKPAPKIRAQLAYSSPQEPQGSERPRFGPKEATREQRQEIVARAAAVNATANRKMSPFGEALNRRYIEGELSLAECSAELTRHYEQLYPKR